MFIEGDDGPDDLDGTGDSDFILGYGGNDTIRGRSGDDDIRGGDGSNFIYGGQGNDDIDSSDPSIDSDSSNLFGDAGDDSILGDDGDDNLYGGEGDDTLTGGGGADASYGGDGNDVIRISNRGSILNGGLGRDELDLSGTDQNWSVDLSDLEMVLKHAGGGRSIATGFESVRTGLGNDKILGTNDRNFIFSGDGEDVIRGRKGADTIDGFLGQDTIDGGGGADLITHSVFSFILNDGADELTGGGGPDTFSFFRTWHSPADNPDIITDFASSFDAISLRGFHNGTSTVTLTFIGTAAFTGLNQVRCDNGILEVNVNGNTDADFRVILAGVDELQTSDLLLA